MGPFKIISIIGGFYCQLQWAHSWSLAAFIGSCNAPIHDLRQLSLAAVMGPLKAKGSFSCQLQWAHSLSLAAFICICNGPILDPRQHFLVAEMGPFKVIGSFYL
jgi:hypothetical protein